MKNIIRVILFISYFGVLSCYGENKVVEHWLAQIGNGENLNELIILDGLDYSKLTEYFGKIPADSPMSFLHCMGRIDRNFPYGWEYKGNAPDTRLIAPDLIIKVLARKKPLYNYYENKKAYPNGGIKEIYRSGNIICYDYLGIFQSSIVRLLTEFKDMRFEKDAFALLNYLLVPLNKDLFDYKKMHETDARWNYTPDSCHDLRVVLLEYLNLFREKRGQKKIDPYIDKKTLYSKYNFGRNCHYYDLKNWKEYVIPIYEEELKYGNVNLDDPRLKFLYKDRLPEIINAYARKIKSSFKSHVIFINQRKKRGKKINKWDIEKYNSYFMKWINWCKKHNRKCEISEEDLKVFKQ